MTQKHDKFEAKGIEYALTFDYFDTQDNHACHVPSHGISTAAGFVAIAASLHGKSYVFMHYSDVIMGAIASLITSLTSVYSSIHPSVDKKNIKAPRHWPLCGEFTGDRWILHTNGQ